MQSRWRCSSTLSPPVKIAAGAYRMRTENDEEKTAEVASNVVRIHIVIEEVERERERESESSVNESEAVYIRSV